MTHMIRHVLAIPTEVLELHLEEFPDDTVYAGPNFVADHCYHCSATIVFNSEASYTKFARYNPGLDLYLL